MPSCILYKADMLQYQHTVSESPSVLLASIYQLQPLTCSITMFIATSIVLLIQNVLTKEFLMYNESAAAMHSIKAHQGSPIIYNYYKMLHHACMMYINCPDTMTTRVLYHTGNFHLTSASSGTANHLQMFADSSIKLHPENGTNYLRPKSQNDTIISSGGSASAAGSADELPQCSAVADVGSMDSQWYVEELRGSINIGVRLYTLNENGEKWYLKAHFHGRTVDLVCEDYVNSVDDVSGQYHGLCVN